MRVIVTASRFWDDPDVIWNDLDTVLAHGLPGSLTLVHGACVDHQGRLAGGDAHADEWATRHQAQGIDIEVEPYPMRDFGRDRAAGPRRNLYMVKLGADLVMGYPLDRSPGTRGCLRMAREAGLRVYERGTGPTLMQVLFSH